MFFPGTVTVSTTPSTTSTAPAFGLGLPKPVPREIPVTAEPTPTVAVTKQEPSVPTEDVSWSAPPPTAVSVVCVYSWNALMLFSLHSLI